MKEVAGRLMKGGNNKEKWIFVVDGGRGRLLRGSNVPPGRPHLEEDESIENPWEEHEHGRPSPRAGKLGHTYASQGHEGEELLHRFARDVVLWLERKSRQHKIENLLLFAPPRFLGALRQVCPASLTARITEHEGDLGYMTAGDLARHRVIARLLGAGAGDGH
jgi:protein required for attachment to host cells